METGGARAAARLCDLMLSTELHIPSSAASNVKLAVFVRALVVDLSTVWAPGDQLGAVMGHIKTLSAENVSLLDVAGTLSRADVTKQRLLCGAVACLGPAFCLSPRVPELFVGVLTAKKEPARLTTGTSPTRKTTPTTNPMRRVIAARATRAATELTTKWALTAPDPITTATVAQTTRA